jgi:hypothetical protein
VVGGEAREQPGRSAALVMRCSGPQSASIHLTIKIVLGAGDFQAIRFHPAAHLVINVGGQLSGHSEVQGTSPDRQPTLIRPAVTFTLPRPTVPDPCPW